MAADREEPAQLELGMLARIVDSPHSRGVIDRFIGTLESRHYAVTEPVSLLAADSTLTFVNATITPFKRRLSAGLPIGRICQFQPCLRAHGEYPWLFAFGMTGLLADIAGMDDLCAVAEDGYAAILAAIPGSDPGRVHCLVDARDADLLAAATEAAARHGGQVTSADRPGAGTRWKYGDAFPLSGRGVTYFYRRDGYGCEQPCPFDCRCGRWVPVANFILVTDGRVTYGEVGLGVEVTAAISFGPDAYSLPEIRSRCERAIAAGIPEREACDLVNLYRATAILAEAGCVPSGKGQGSVQRKFTRRMIGLLAEFNDDAADDLLRQFGATGELLEAVGAERVRSRRAATVNTRAAISLLDRRPGTSDEQIRSTYGLNDVQLALVRTARRRPPR